MSNVEKLNAGIIAGLVGLVVALLLSADSILWTSTRDQPSYAYIIYSVSDIPSGTTLTCYKQDGNLCQMVQQVQAGHVYAQIPDGGFIEYRDGRLVECRGEGELPGFSVCG